MIGKPIIFPLSLVMLVNQHTNPRGPHMGRGDFENIRDKCSPSEHSNKGLVFVHLLESTQCFHTLQFA